MFIQPKRVVKKIFIHCSASDNPKHNNVSVIRKWHLERGFSDVGYHYFITRNGKVQPGRSLEKAPAAQRGHNHGSIAICVHGLKRFAKNQLDSLVTLCAEINDTYDGEVSFHGHCEVSDKTCPVFDYRKVLALDAYGMMDNTMVIRSNINSEKDVRVAVMASLKEIHAVRVENNENLPPGFPDLSTSCGEIELKFIRSKPARPETAIKCQHFTYKQREWIKRRNAAGGMTWVLLWLEGLWMLFEGSVAVEHLGCTIFEELVPKAHWTSTAVLPDGLVDVLKEARGIREARDEWG